ncbi:MAG: hypothetical protein FJ405_12535 [Verrucomicrobia bacterium]|nr:hypothetical protein [Verrucomicrobiota bacterium]
MILSPSGHSKMAGPTRPRSGFVLLAVLVVILMGSMVALSLMFRLRADETASMAGSSSEQAWAAAMVGVREAIRVAQRTAPGELGWQDDPKTFRDRWVSDDGTDRWYFSVYSPPLEGELQELRYGLTDEASKLNVNASHTADLTQIQNLTPALVASIRDFIDPDVSTRPDGAEQEYYDTLPVPYVVRNGPLNSIDELLLVRGFTPSLLYGEDRNMNLRLDANENDGVQSAPLDNADGRLSLGLRSVLTVHSYDNDLDSEGGLKTVINDSFSGFPSVELPAAVTNFITLLRTNRLRVNHAAELLQARAQIKDEKGGTVDVDSGIGGDEIAVVLERFTATRTNRMEGLINANTAPSSVLATVPGIDPPLADAIVSGRKAISPERRTNLAWMFQEGVMTAEQFRAIVPHLCARSLQYHFYSVGFSVPSGRFRVLEVTIDLGSPSPSILYLRDITRMGPPFRFDSAQQKEAIGG